MAIFRNWPFFFTFFLNVPSRQVLSLKFPHIWSKFSLTLVIEDKLDIFLFGHLFVRFGHLWPIYTYGHNNQSASKWTPPFSKMLKNGQINILSKKNNGIGRFLLCIWPKVTKKPYTLL